MLVGRWQLAAGSQHCHLPAAVCRLPQHNWYSGIETMSWIIFRTEDSFGSSPNASRRTDFLSSSIGRWISRGRF